jgi:3-oxoacyl-[acyl-carrier-protein] synthase II
MLLWAGHEALTQAGWKPGESLQVVLGTTSGGMISGESYFRQAIQTPRRLRGQASRVAHYQPQRQGITLLDAFGLQGSVTIVSNACVSGATAIGHAWELVRSGRAGKVLAGGFDALCQITYSGFDSLRVLSTTTCRPFDTQRDGLVLGEGAGLLCLESLESATDRGAGILGEIIGYGSCLSTAPLTCPHPEGEATLASMRQACSYQGVEPGDVGYVNAHGTGTPLNDAAEGHAINRWAGRNARQLWVSSTKACIGHTLGAAGAIEAIVCLMTLQEHWLPPQVTSVAVDPLCKFNVVRERTEWAPQTVLSNSCSFGGTSVTLAFRRGSCSG